MPIEYQMLVFSVVLLFVVVLVQVLVGTREMGLMPLAGPRDRLPEPSQFLARIGRTSDNHKEGLIFFAPLILIAGQTDSFSALTALGAQLFFYSRLVHAVLYIAGVPAIRPLAWFVGIVGTGLVLYSLFN